MANRIVAVFGMKRTGKDTLGDELVRSFGYQKLHFADTLRDVLYVTDPYIDGTGKRLCEVVDDIGWEKTKETYPECRRLLQRLGTEGIRHHLGSHSWIEALERKVDAIDGPAVITDGRFYNESVWAKNMGGIVVRMHRRWGVPPEEDLHSSEQEISKVTPDIDIVIEGGMDEVRSHAKRVNDLAKRIEGNIHAKLS